MSLSGWLKREQGQPPPTHRQTQTTPNHLEATCVNPHFDTCPRLLKGRQTLKVGSVSKASKIQDPPKKKKEFSLQTKEMSQKLPRKNTKNGKQYRQAFADCPLHKSLFAPTKAWLLLTLITFCGSNGHSQCFNHKVKVQLSVSKYPESQLGISQKGPNSFRWLVSF